MKERLRESEICAIKKSNVGRRDHRGAARNCKNLQISDRTLPRKKNTNRLVRRGREGGGL